LNSLNGRGSETAQAASSGAAPSLVTQAVAAIVLATIKSRTIALVVAL